MKQKSELTLIDESKPSRLEPCILLGDSKMSSHPNHWATDTTIFIVVK